MPMVARKAPYTLFIVDDNDPMNPREENEKKKKMICFHNRYKLGDKHDSKEPRDFLQDMLFSKYSSYPNSQYGKPIYEYIKNGNAKEARLEYNRSSREWELLENQHWSSNSDWYVSSSYPASLKGKEVPDWFLENCLSALKISELKDILEKTEGMVILPLFLYDHSGITMNTGGFSCAWDSGQVGWIYADYDMIKNNYGEVTPETIAKAETLLESEVKEYDYYLTGQCYGFKLYEGDNQIDSCWGFLGEINDVSKYIKEHLPSECENIIDSLEFQCDIDEDEYLEQALEDEDEEDMEL
jgi:hypothetical protein